MGVNVDIAKILPEAQRDAGEEEAAFTGALIKGFFVTGGRCGVRHGGKC
jgi:hypothetical protein